MMDLITEHIATWTGAQVPKANGGRGHGRGTNGQSPYGIKKLRELILELSVRGKLVPQDPNDEPASVLLEMIAKEKARLIKEGKIKKQKPLPKISEDEKPFELPQGWAWARLGENGLGATGKTPPTGNHQYYGGDIPFIGPGQITPEGKIIESDKGLTEEGCKHSATAEKGDILMVCIGGSIGKSAIAPSHVSFNQQINCIRPLCIDSTYLNSAMNTPHFQASILDAATGSATPIINRSKWEDLLVSLPPLAEQHRIVAKVDELMALCDKLEQQQTDSSDIHQTLVENLLATLTTVADPAEFALSWQRIAAHFDTLFTTEESIDQLKQTILQLAVMGKLVPQDPNDEPASTLLEKIAKEKARLIKEGKIKKQKPLPKISEDEKPFELPVGWTCSRIGNFTIVGTGATPSREKSNYFSPAEINWVTSGETSSDLITETREKISPLAVSETNVTVYPIGTLIVAMYGQGKTRGQISELLVEAGTNQACAAIQPIESEPHHRKYIKLFFKKAYEELRSQAAGGAQPNLNVVKVTNTVVLLPPIAEQHRIVAKVDELMALCNTLKERLRESQITQVQLANAIVEQAVA